LERLYTTLERHYNNIEWPCRKFKLNCTQMCKLKTCLNQLEVEELSTSDIELYDDPDTDDE